MATIESVFSKNLYTTVYDYSKVQGVNGVKPRTYDGTVLLAAGLTQKNGNDYPLIHAKDVQIGQVASERLTDKLAAYDAILREIYGSSSPTALGNFASLTGISSILNDSDTSVNDRISALRMWKTISIGSVSTATGNGDQNTTSVTADTNASTVQFSPSNKWIRLAGTDGTTNKVSFGHLVGTISSSTATSDLNNSGTFAMPVLTYDEAGHITGVTTTTYTLPYNWKSITTSNNANGTSAITTSDATISAATNVDTLTIAAGNKWVQLAAATNASSKTVTIGHALSTLTSGAHASGNSWAISAQSPNFGASFNLFIPTFTFTTDAAGHVTAFEYGSTTASVTLPQCSLTDTAANGNVITGLSLTQSTGAFSTSRANIGTLAITGYSKGTNKSALAANDTLNAALAKLENQIAAEVSDRGTAVTGVATRVSTIENTLNDEDDGVVSRVEVLERTASELATTYQPIGSYQPAGNYQAAGDYVVADASDPYLKTSAIQSLVNDTIAALKANYTFALIPITVTASYASGEISASVNAFEGTGTIWLEKIEGSSQTSVSVPAPIASDGSTSFTVTANGTYRVAVRRDYESSNVVSYSSEITVDDLPEE